MSMAGSRQSEAWFWSRLLPEWLRRPLPAEDHGESIGPPTVIAPTVPTISRERVMPGADFHLHAEHAFIEMLAVKEVFSNWVDQLDKLPPRPEISATRDAAERIQQAACSALDAAREIVKCHQEFCVLMAMALGRATADPSGSMRPDRAIIAKGDEICTRSEGLCSHARIIQEGLSALGREIEKLRDSRRKQGFWSKLKEWLVKIFGIVAHLISGVTSLLGIAHPAAIAGSAIFSALSDVAYIFMNKANASEAELDKIVSFIRETIPQQMEKAQQHLSNVEMRQAALQLQVELVTRNLRISREDAYTAWREWQRMSEHLGNMRNTSHQ
ncbi:hypothetical protein AcW2_007121 [Taiwanofungus camphoratus]|nr:hypothetical protein AcW2_007121 [Antrodia cinnamomea]